MFCRIILVFLIACRNLYDAFLRYGRISGDKVNRGKCKFGASGTYAWYLVWHCFWSGTIFRIYTVPYSRTCPYSSRTASRSFE